MRGDIGPPLIGIIGLRPTLVGNWITVLGCMAKAYFSNADGVLNEDALPLTAMCVCAMVANLYFLGTLTAFVAWHCEARLLML